MGRKMVSKASVLHFGVTLGRGAHSWRNENRFSAPVVLPKALLKTRGAPTAPKTGCAVQTTTPPLRRARSGSRRSAHAF
jgi:hypothetical protein